MNNFYSLFSGTIKGVEVKTVKTEFGIKQFRTVVVECERLNFKEESTTPESTSQTFYLRLWGDKYSDEDVKIGRKAHFWGNVEYRKVKSAKAFVINSFGEKEKFEYGAFDFTIWKIWTDKELAAWYLQRAKDLR